MPLLEHSPKSLEASFMQQTQPSFLRAFSFILCLSVISFFIGIGDRDLWSADEMRYASTIHDMLASGDWLSPQFNQHPDGEKPPLFYWLGAWVGSLQAVPNGLVVLLPAALGGFLSLLFAFLLGNLLFGRTTAFYASSMLATCQGFAWQGRVGQMDSLFGALVLAAIFFAFKALQLHGSKQRLLYLILGYVFCGLAWLVKGPLAFLLVASAVIIFLFCNQQLKKLSQLGLWWGIPLVVLIVAPWYLALGTGEERGWAIVTKVLWQQNVQRYLDFHWGGTDPWYVYYKFLPKFLPWTILFLCAIWYALKGQTEKLITQRFLLLWFGCFVVFFLLSSSRRDAYLYPFYPVAAFLSAHFWLEASKPKTNPAKKRALVFNLQGFAWLSFLGAIGFAMYLFFVDFRYPNALTAIWLAIIPLVAGFWLATYFARKEKFSAAFLGLVACLLISFLGIFVGVIPRLDPYKSRRPLAAQVLEKATNHKKIWTYRMEPPWLIYNATKPLAGYFESQNRLRQVLQEGDYVILQESHYAALPSELRATTKVLNDGTSAKGVMLIQKLGVD